MPSGGEGAAKQHALSAVLEDATLFHLVVLRLHQADVLRLSCCCKSAQRYVATLKQQRLPWYKRKVFVTCSKNATLAQLDASTGQVLFHTSTQCSVVHGGRRKKRAINSCSKRKASNWITSLAVSPYNHDVFLSDYAVNGTVQLCTHTLTPKALYRHSSLDAPEGLAFLRGSLFVVSALRGAIVRISIDCGSACRYLEELELGAKAVPWGLVAEPVAQSNLPTNDSEHWGSLFVSADDAYHQPNYCLPPPQVSGTILRVHLSEEGGLKCVSRYSAAKLRRPSGICFSHEGDLLVTTMDKLILTVAGPHRDLPGSIVCVFDTSAWVPDVFPWDVLQVCDVLFVTLHSDTDSGLGAIAVATLSGQLIRVVRHPVLIHPNMMALE